MSKSIFLHFFSVRNLLFYLLTSYLLYHFFLSNNGIIAYFDLKNQLKANQQAIQDLSAKYEDLAIEIGALNPSNPSPDMMDEHVKTKLNFIKEDEILLINTISDE